MLHPTDSVTGARFAVADGLVYLLTSCCGASAKGSSNSPTGACCRACYAPIPAELGMCWFADQFVDEYPAWCESHGITEGTPGTLRSLAEHFGRALGLEVVTA